MDLNITREKLERTPQDYTKIPVTIQAMRHDGTRETAHRMQRWMWEQDSRTDIVCTKQEDGTYSIGFRTIDGNLCAVVSGMWLLRGVEGEFYPCQDSIFRKTYASA